MHIYLFQTGRIGKIRTQNHCARQEGPDDEHSGAEDQEQVRGGGDAGGILHRVRGRVL